MLNLSRCAFFKRLVISAITCFCACSLSAQTGTVTGTVTDSTGVPVPNAEATYIGATTKTTVDAKGNFSLNVPSGKDVVFIVHFSGYREFRQTVNVADGQTLHLDVTLKRIYLGVVDIVGKHDDFGYIPPVIHDHLPAPVDDISKVLVYSGYAFSNNELSTQYSVRGGNFDENLVYVNDIEVYRPFLTRAGQQEGLSFVNPDMTSSIFFSAGGFEAKYGDKMASVLDIQYRHPTKFAGTASASLLGMSAEVEGVSNDSRFTWMLGVRQKSNRYLLKSLDTKGDYTADFTDAQAYLTYTITDNWSLDYLGNFAINKYQLIPSSRETDFGTINNALRFTVYFDGREINRFRTGFNALSLNYSDNRHWRTKFILSSFNTYETETFDVQGQYYIDQLEADFGKPTFGQVAFNRGVGTFLNHARNYLDAWVNNGEIKSWYTSKKYSFLCGLRYQNEYINNDLSEWNYVDSAGYSIPYLPLNSIDLQDVVKSTSTLNSNRFMGYVEGGWESTLRDSSHFKATFGLRGNYWDLNHQLIVSPRVQFSWKPHWKTNIEFRASGGLYDQPPFFRDLMDLQGHINKNIRAQTSVHAVLGSDLNFNAWGRPFRFIAEAYYKYLDNLIPYEVNDVRIRYLGSNMSYGYGYGLDLKVNGEFVKGVESWVNLSLMRTRENLYNDVYYIRLNSDGDTIINGYTFNNVAVDSIKKTPGFIPRPTDQLLTFSMYFQDYLPVLPDCKMNLGIIVGSGLPFGPPLHQRYLDVFRMPPYRRVDIGFSYQVIKEDKPVKSSNPFHVLKSLWVGVEVFNLLQVQNTISYYWVKDVTGRMYAVPNYLTNRELSVKMIVKF